MLREHTTLQRDGAQADGAGERPERSAGHRLTPAEEHALRRSAPLTPRPFGGELRPLDERDRLAPRRL
jgi:hypothetical protein